MPELKRVFTSGRMNKDLDARIIPNGEYRDAQNIEIATSEGSDVGSVQNIPGTTLRNARIYKAGIVDTTWAVNFGLSTLTSLGSIVDTKENKIYWFLHGLASDGTVYNLIMEYDEATNVVEPVLIDRTTSGSTILNFSTTTKITGINIIDGWLLWTDNVTEPKQLEINTWKLNSSNSNKTHTSITQWPNSTKFPTTSDAVFKEEHITVIKKSPLKAPTVTTSTTNRDETINLNGTGTNSSGLGEESVITEYNFYKDGFATPNDLTIHSMSSNPGFYFNTSPNWQAGDTVEFTHTHAEVGNILTFFKFRAEVMSETGSLTSPDGVYVSLKFINIPSNIDVLGDNVKSWHVTLVEDDPMWELQFPRFAYRWKYSNGQYSCYSPFTSVVFLPSEFKYLAADGHNVGMTNTIRRVKLSGFDDKPDDVVEVDILYKESNNNLVHIVDTLDSLTDGWNGNTEIFQLEEHEIYGAIIPEVQLLRPWDNVPRKALAQEISGNRLIYGNYVQNYNIGESFKPNISTSIDAKNPVYLSTDSVETEIKTNATHDFDLYSVIPKQSLKSMRTYQVGIVYQDKYGRQSPVLTSPTASKNIVKSPYSSKTNSLKVQASNEPPNWATHFKYFIKEVSGEYYNLSMDRYYSAEDNNIWLSFPSSERNKVDEETFLILKKRHGAHHPVELAARYKILQIENDVPEFVSMTKAYQGEANVKLRGGGAEAPVAGNLTFSFVGPSHIEHAEFAKSFSHDCFVQIGENFGGRLSRKYEIARGGLTGEIEDTSSVEEDQFPHHNNSIYQITLKKPIAEEDKFVNDLTSSGMRILTYQKTVRHLPEYEGRFFVKIKRDAIINEEILETFPETVIEYAPVASQLIYANIYNYLKDPSETYTENGNNTKKQDNWIRPRRPKDDEKGYGIVFAGWKDKYCESPKRSDGVLLSTGGVDPDSGEFSFHPRTVAGSGGGSCRIFVSPYEGGTGRPANQRLHRPGGSNDWSVVDGAIKKDLDINPFFDKLTTGCLIQFEGKKSSTDATRTKGLVYEVRDCRRRYERRGYNVAQTGNARVEFRLDFHQVGNTVSGYADHFEKNTPTMIDKMYIVQKVNPEEADSISSSNPAIWETEPKEMVDLDIYHEASNAYPIAEHKDWKTLSYHNCFSFGNGVESNRIRDDFNQIVIDKGPKVSTIVSEQYKEENRKTGLIFSGIFNSTNGVNRLNQFLMAEPITKDINPHYGSIQKLHSRNTDLITFCEDKVIRVLANKDALYNADGNMQLTASTNVLGQAIPYTGEYGISKNPESFASHAYRVYFTDKARGAVLRLSSMQGGGGDGLTNIAEKGMTDWFKDNLASSTLFVGSYDEKKGLYNITLSDQTVSFDEKVGGWTSFKTFIPETAVSLNDTYYTMKNGNLYSHDSNTKNTFYGNFANSTISLVFNDAPSAVKGFQTLNYDGTQARTYTYVTGTIGLDATTGAYNTSGHSQTEKTKGWYASSITTDLQTGGVIEFIDKEGRWYNYIKGDTTSLTNLDSKEFSVQGIGKYSVLGGAAVSKRNLTVKLVPFLVGSSTPLSYVTTTEYGPTAIEIGGGVQSTIGDQILKIKPINKTSITLAGWTVGTLPTGVESVVFSLNGDDIDATVHFDDGTPNTAYLMPSAHTTLEIPVYSNLIGGAIVDKVDIAGTLNVTKTNATQTQAMVGGITGNVAAATYTASSDFDNQAVVDIFTVTFTATSGYHFNVTPTADVIIEDSNKATKYDISSAHTTNSDGQITATVFTIKYRFGSDIDRAGDEIKFVANAIKIPVEVIEIRGLSVDDISWINATNTGSGQPKRTIYVSGHPDAEFTLTHNNGSTTTTLKTDQAIGQSGKYPIEVTFPNVTVDTVHTFTLTSFKDQLADPFPNPNPLLLYQYLNSTITWRFQSSTLGLTTSGGSTNTVDVVNTGSPGLEPETNNVNGDINVSWIVDTPASIPLKTYGTTPTGDAPLFTNVDSNNYNIEFLDVTETFSSKGGGAPTGTRLTLAATGDIHQFGTGAVVSVLDIESFIKFNEAPVSLAQSGINVGNNTVENLTLTLTSASAAIQTAEGDTLAYSIVSNGSKGTAAVTNAATGACTYTPTNSGSTGADSFTFKVNDGHQDSNTSTIALSIASSGGSPAYSISYWEKDTEVAYDPYYSFTPTDVTVAVTNFSASDTGNVILNISDMDFNYNSGQGDIPSYVNQLSDLTITVVTTGTSKYGDDTSISPTSGTITGGGTSSVNIAGLAFQAQIPNSGTVANGDQLNIKVQIAYDNV